MVRIKYTDAGGELQCAEATLLDWVGHGPIFSLEGQKTVLAWDRLVSVGLVED